MSRKSEDKLVKDSFRHSQLWPRYIKLLDQLNRSHKIIVDHEFSRLVNFKTNIDIPRHSWFTYKQGYSEKLVTKILLEEKPSKNYFVLDPFAGVGTTNLVAQNLGYRSIGLDINPVASFAAAVKTTIFTESEVEKINKGIKNFSPNIKPSSIPDSSLLKTSFLSESFNQLMFIKGFFEKIHEEKIRSFFKLAYLSIIEDASNRLKDGNGIKLVKNKRVIKNLYKYYLDKCKSMAEDIRKFNIGKESIIINGSLNVATNFNGIKDKKVGIVIFSPPYANCFDYCEVYKLELWMGDFVKQYEDFKKYRNMAIRSHVNASFDHGIKNQNEKVDLISDVISCFNIWNKNIPDMVRGYFDDMTEILKKLHSLMVSGAKCFIVVANSGYKGVLVPTDLLLAELAEQYGFKPLRIIYARKIRASSQQMNELHNGYQNLMRESIVILEKI